ncbi:type II toxin-antitoxin system VapC family toxin [Streptomyces sp. NBC_00878]|uniref:type II toxin-antitoxin system VapC family toxin n=1 Tax=Streptomyces sp. NBC_00878 TaxID=2975854 RepID=UPI00224C8D5B|nr:PIN domain-containing protein [Streptomyces sp. NBC_00878]MCX4909269.1 PIN domain-containing protein [Streptomyces sp. NBC_00878]
MIAIADTSGIIASVDRSCPEHEVARHVMDTAGLLVIPQLVLAELDHLVSGRFHKDAAGQVMDQLIAQARTGRYVLGDASADVLADARLVQRRYRDLALDLTDSVITVLAREYATDAVLTLDRKDFRAVRPLTSHPAFRILPDDL